MLGPFHKYLFVRSPDREKHAEAFRLVLFFSFSTVYRVEQMELEQSIARKLKVCFQEW